MKKFSISSPILWTFTSFSGEQMFWLGWSNKSIALTLLVLKSPFFTEIVYYFFTLNLSHRQLSLISFTSTSRSLSNSIVNFVLSFFFFVKHSTWWSWFFNFDEWFRPASISHSFLYKRRVYSFFLKYFLEFLHAFIFLARCSVPFKCVLLSESMLFLFNFLKRFLIFWFNKSLLILLNLHSLHLH